MRLVLFALLTALAACSAAPTPTVVPPTAPPATAVVPQETGTPAPPTPTPRPTHTAVATFTPNPTLSAATLPALADADYPGSEITTVRVLTPTAAFTTSLVTYESDGLTISGILNVPTGEGPFPAVVLVHGYVAQDQYHQRLDTQAAADYLAANGFVTFEPDLRGYADSEHGMNIYLAGFTADVLNAGASVKTLPQVDPERVAVWGHSMGGGVAARALVVADVFDAGVLYAPLSADMGDMFIDPFGGEPQGVTPELVRAVIAGIESDEFKEPYSPKNYWERVRVPVSIHVGADDRVTPPVWSLAIRDGLLAAGKTVEFFEYEGQGHSIRPPAESEFHELVLEFLERVLQ